MEAPNMSENNELSLVRGQVGRQEFGSSEIQTSAETAIAAVAARERAAIEAMYIMAERHPRNWDNVRVRLLAHCSRPGFADIARYRKPTGKRQVDGQWKETFAEGLSARFAEVARMEAGNLWMGSSVVYENDLIRVIRIFVVDTERNNNDSREVTVAKVTEKRGKKNKSTGEWEPPEGRETVGQPRINSYGDPVWLCKATDDETRARQNSEISKTQRDESLRLIPIDIRDDCEAMILKTLNDPKKTDPTAARKKIIDAFANLGRLPSDLEKYIGCPLDRLSPVQIDELRGLYTAINDGELTFEEAMRRKWDADYTTADREAVRDQKVAEAEKLEHAKAAQQEAERQRKGTAPGETPADRDARIQRQMEEQLAAQKTQQAQSTPILDLAEWPANPYESKLGFEIRVGGKWFRRPTADSDEWKEVKATEQNGGALADTGSGNPPRRDPPKFGRAK
jgi:hypothetical protein